MRTAQLVRQSLRVMARSKLRSGFMMLGSLVGVAALTLVVSLGEAGNRKMLTTVDQIFGGSSIVVFARGGRQVAGPRGESARLTLDDVEAIARELPGIEAWDAQQGLSDAAVRYGDASGTARIMGQTERSERVWHRGVSRGEYFDTAAVAGSARVALLGETVARDLFGGEDPLGAEILIGSVRFRVIGILEAFGTDAHGMDRDDEVVVPISTAMRRLMNADSIRMAKLLVKDPDAVAATAGDVERILRERHAIAPGQPDDFMIRTSLQVQEMVSKVQRVLFLFLPLVAGVSLLAGSFVAASLMLSQVNERVGEIGLRRAVGARPEDIQVQFLLETAVTALGGGLLGLLAGCAGAQYIARRMALGDVLSWQAIALGLGAAAVTGLLAGVVPARRAARLQPAEALR
ncbi:MAG TPA: ABC transporter permease [Thermoanaerobaculia bacterium]|nr:ABC transporter permease [Thermoanaerobaculia bacterium]